VHTAIAGGTTFGLFEMRIIGQSVNQTLSSLEFLIDRKETYVNTPWDEWSTGYGPIIAFVAYLFVSPVVLTVKVYHYILGKVIEKRANGWTEFGTTFGYKLLSKPLGASQRKELKEHFGKFKWLDACYVRSEPQIEGLGKKQFHFEALKVDLGVFLISFSAIPHGMKLWFLHGNSGELELVMDMECYNWTISNQDRTSVKLHAEDFKSGDTYKTGFTYMITIKPR